MILNDIKKKRKHTLFEKQNEIIYRDFKEQKKSLESN